MVSDPHTETAHRICPSPLGDLLLAATPRGICSLGFDAATGESATARQTAASTGSADNAARQILALAAAQLTDYFAGERGHFELPLDTAGTTFQQQVWTALRQIPTGDTLCYQELASRINRPRAARAVGAACAHNPLPVIVPCHRIINTDGSPGGYLGGADRKAWLIRHEEHLMN